MATCSFLMINCGQKMESETVDQRQIGNTQVLVKTKSKQPDTLLALF